MMIAWHLGAIDKMRGLMYSTSHYMDTEQKKEIREISNPLIQLVIPTGVEPVFSAWEAENIDIQATCFL